MYFSTSFKLKLFYFASFQTGLTVFKSLFCWFSTTLFFLPYDCRYNISYRNLIGWEGLQACFDWLSEIDWLSFDQFVFIYIFQRVAFILSFLLRSRNFERQYSSTPFCKDLRNSPKNPNLSKQFDHLVPRKCYQDFSGRTSLTWLEKHGLITNK